MSNDQPLVAIVVLNWRKPAETLACVQSLSHITYRRAQIIVVDNASDDGIVRQLGDNFPDVAALKTGANLGYAGGNNVGIRHALAAGADAVLVLNNDTIVDPGFLEPLIDAANQGARPAVVTSAVCEMTRPDILWALGAEIDWRAGTVKRLHAGEQYGPWRNACPSPVGYAAGSAMLAPRSIWEQIGCIEESYFLYYEEADWCVRASKAGFDILAVPQSRVLHEVHGEQGRNSPAVTYYMARNALWFLRRNLAPADRRRPMLRVILREQLHALTDVKRREYARAAARMSGLLDYALGRTGPRPQAGLHRNKSR